MMDTTDTIIAQKHAAAARRFKIATITIAAIAVLVVVSMVVTKMLSAPPAAPVDTPPVNVVLHSENSENARQTFLQRYATFEAEYKTTLANPLLAVFDQQAHNALVNLEEKALAGFARSAFQTAVDDVQALIDGTIELNSQWIQAHAKAIEQANNYYADGNIQRATLAFQQAKVLNPAHPANADVARRIADFDRLNTLKQQLAIALAENNARKQQQILRDLLTMPEQFAIYSQQYDEVTAKLTEQRLSALLTQARQAVQRKDIEAAAEQLAAAKAIKPNAVAIGQIEDELNGLRQQQSKASWLQRLASASDQDNWQRVLVEAKAAASQFSDEPRFAEYQQQALGILHTQRRIALFLDQPQRLSDTGLRQQAKLSLQQAVPLMLNSAALAGQVQQLGEYIDRYDQPLTVVIESDGLSYIDIVGVGQVGMTTRKNIQLTSGTYTAEAKRRGYKTKRKSFTVSQQSANRVFIANDEEI